MDARVLIRYTNVSSNKQQISQFRNVNKATENPSILVALCLLLPSSFSTKWRTRLRALLVMRPFWFIALLLLSEQWSLFSLCRFVQYDARSQTFLEIFLVALTLQIMTFSELYSLTSVYIHSLRIFTEDKIKNPYCMTSPQYIPACYVTQQNNVTTLIICYCCTEYTWLLLKT